MSRPLREHALAILRAALAAADARAAVVRALRVDGVRLTVAGAETIDLSSIDRVLLIGAGKAAAAMAAGALDVLGDRIAEGTITTKDGHGADLPRIEVWEAAHPVPDTRGMAGASDALRLARAAGPRDLVLCLLSGGASALWPAPVPGVSLTQLREVTDALLRSGATIHEINTVRKHLSRIGGGWLARAAAPARVVTLAISDVVGGALDVIASGPTVPDPTTYADALEVLRDRGIHLPPAILAHLQAGDDGERDETPKPYDAAFERATAHVVAGGRDALAGAARVAERLGYVARIVAEDVEGEARSVGEQVAQLAMTAVGEYAEAPLALLLGGETTVTVLGSGRGGRNQELALAAAIELEGVDGVLAASIGTDGTDGPTDAAGAFADGGTVARGHAAGLDARDALRRNDAYPFLRAAGDLIVTGPTGTHVNDVVLVLVDAVRG
ncbi:glycerate kinase type-2 family protein [Longimicrobium sp.]|uniref:glycerate kinase type-2 family protein n=1 Tax=Longimicrobium sp. TaxID=2029185 RepID=UPI003B3B7ABC